MIEMLMTAHLMLAVFMLAGEKHKATFMAPIGSAFFPDHFFGTDTESRLSLLQLDCLFLSV